MALPGPDYPAPRKKLIVKAVKPKRPKTTKRNRYSSPAPVPSRAPIDPSTGRPYPSNPPSGTGYRSVPRTASTPGPGVYSPGTGAAAGGPPAAAGPNTYPEYAAYPEYQQQLMALDAAQKSQQDYASGTVAPWLSGALSDLTGVNPARLGINPTAQQQYLANVQGVVGGALNAAAAGAQGPAVASTTPGGIAASPASYLSGAAAQGDYGRSSGMLQSAQAQSALNTLQPNTTAQGEEYALAALQNGMSLTYATKRAALRSSIDQFISTMAQEQAKMDEAARHNRVTEAISATNATTNAAYQAANLGLKSSGQAFDQTTATTAAATPAPYGYQRDPATGKLVRDPSVPAASANPGGTGKPSAAAGQYPPNTLAKQGFVGGWKVKPTAKPLGAKGSFVRATDGTWWIKPAGAPSASTKTVKTSGDLVLDLKKKYSGGATGPFSSGSPGWTQAFGGDPGKVSNAVLEWVIQNKLSFSNPDGTFNHDKFTAVVGALGGPNGKNTLSRVSALLLKGHIDKNGRLV